MKILITGSNGFIGKNLIENLKINKKYEIYEFNKNDNISDLEKYCIDVDFVFHLAGVNRPTDNDYKSNITITEHVVNFLEKNNNPAPIIFTSSIQSVNTNYGKSKKKCEGILKKHSEKENGGEIFIYKLPNIFGKWSKPNYNSVVATWCYNILNKLPISISDPETIINLVHIDDVINDFINVLNNRKSMFNLIQVKSIKLGLLKNILMNFNDIISGGIMIPSFDDDFEKNLFSTFISFIKEDMDFEKNISFTLNQKNDERGSFTEMFKNSNLGQISINIIKPKKTKGNHWHNTKIEKFVVVSGRGVIRLKNINNFDNNIHEIFVSDDDIKIINILPGFIHNIENIDEKRDMIVIIWVNEIFNSDKPDTYYSEI